jgi:hypothetical protein
MTHQEVLDAETPFDGPITQCQCGALATKLWPAIPGCKLTKAMCDACTEKAKETLLVALGSQAFIPT